MVKHLILTPSPLQSLKRVNLAILMLGVISKGLSHEPEGAQVTMDGQILKKSKKINNSFWNYKGKHTVFISYM